MPKITQAPEETKTDKIKKIAPWATAGLVVAVALVAGLLQFSKVQSLNKQLEEIASNPQKAAEAQVSELVNKVGKLIILPADEEPTIATVTDPELLKEQAFFAQAEPGDKVLIYTKAKKAILYNEASNRIKEVAPVNIGADAQVAGSSTIAKVDVQIKVLNASRVSGLAKKIADNFKAEGFSNVTVGDAIPSTTTVVTYNEELNFFVNDIKKVLNNQGEYKTQTSKGIVITIGSDFVVQ